MWEFQDGGAKPEVFISGPVDMIEHNSDGHTHVFGVTQHGETGRDTVRRLDMLLIKDGGY